MQKNYNITWLLPEILMIKEKNPTIWLDKRQNWPHPAKSSNLRYYLHLMTKSMQKKLRYILILCRNIDDHRILQFDWMWSITSHTQPKVVVSVPISLLWLSPCENSKVLIDTSQKYWWSKHTAVWLIEIAFGYNWRNRFSPDLWFSQNHKEHFYILFLV